MFGWMRDKCLDLTKAAIYLEMQYTLLNATLCQCVFAGRCTFVVKLSKQHMDVNVLAQSFSLLEGFCLN